MRFSPACLQIFAFAMASVACDDDVSRRLRQYDAASFDGLDDSGLDGPPKDSSLEPEGLPSDAAYARDGGETLPVSAIAGYYSGEWGNMLLREVGGEVWAAYTHDQGTIVGTYQSGVLVGWWSEAPTRMAAAQPGDPKDAGEVEFRFSVRNGTPFIDGRWKYGSQEAWRENWDISWVASAPPPDLVQRFENPSLFKRKPMN